MGTFEGMHILGGMGSCLIEHHGLDAMVSDELLEPARLWTLILALLMFDGMFGDQFLILRTHVVYYIRVLSLMQAMAC